MCVRHEEHHVHRQHYPKLSYPAALHSHQFMSSCVLIMPCHTGKDVLPVNEHCHFSSANLDMGGVMHAAQMSMPALSMEVTGVTRLVGSVAAEQHNFDLGGRHFAKTRKHPSLAARQGLCCDGVALCQALGALLQSLRPLRIQPDALLICRRTSSCGTWSGVIRVSPGMFTVSPTGPAE